MPCRTPFYRTHFNGQEKKYRKGEGVVKKERDNIEKKGLI